MSELANNKPKIRSSNLELLRIIAMLSIIAHHYVVNSGLSELFDYNAVSVNMIYMQLFSLWGKTAINVFIMISGYFMCTSKLTIKRYSKVYLEAKFYTVIIFIIFTLLGYEALSLKGVFNLVFGFARGINQGFVPSFLAFYILIPFYNILIKAMNKKQHLTLIAFFVVLFTIIPTFLFADSASTELTWYITIYFIAAYIRLYKQDWMDNNKICILVLMALVLCAYAFVLLVDFAGAKIGFTSITYLTSDSNKILALLIGVFTFLSFKNFKIKNSKFINTIASTTFGVLCIHAGGDTMRNLLWGKIVDVKGHYSLPLPQLILFSIGVILAIFAVCSVIDLVRIYCIEKPVFKWLDKYKWFNKKIG